MTEDIESIVSSINMNQVLVAILENQGKVTIPTLAFLETDTSNKELIIDYDETVPSFTFSLRNNNE